LYKYNQVSVAIQKLILKSKKAFSIQMEEKAFSFIKDFI